MSSTSPRLLQAAIQVAGGTDALAARLGISATMLERYMTGAFPVPDSLTLKALDVILEERERTFQEPAPEPPRASGDPQADA